MHCDSAFKEYQCSQHRTHCCYVFIVVVLFCCYYLLSCNNYVLRSVVSLDVEGAELKVLQSIDYDSVGFGVILVEISRHSPRVNYAVKTFLQSRGYVLTSDEQNSYWFVSQRFSSHYRHILP